MSAGAFHASAERAVAARLPAWFLPRRAVSARLFPFPPSTHRGRPGGGAAPSLPNIDETPTPLGIPEGPFHGKTAHKDNHVYRSPGGAGPVDSR